MTDDTLGKKLISWIMISAKPQKNFLFCRIKVALMVSLIRILKDSSSSETNVSLFEKNQSNIFFSNIASNGIITNKQFLKAIKGFLTNKGCLKNSACSLVVSDLRSDFKDSRFESGYQLFAEVSSLLFAVVARLVAKSSLM